MAGVMLESSSHNVPDQDLSWVTSLVRYFDVTYE